MITVNEMERKLKTLKEYLAESRALAALVSDGVATFGESLVTAYIEALSLAADDTHKWVEWYVWEDDFGARKLKVIANGEEIVVDRVSRLMKVIREVK